MSKIETVGKLPVLRRVAGVGIPTKKLNTVEQKNYREYADKVYANISTMLKEVKRAVLDAFEDDNRDKIGKELVIEYGVQKFVNAIKGLAEKVKIVNEESLKIATNYDSQILRLTTEKEAKIAELKSKKMLPLIDGYNKIKDQVKKASVKNSYISPGLLDNSLKIEDYKEYTYDEMGEKEVRVRYPAIQGCLDYAADEFISGSAVREKLNEKMAPAIAEFQLAEVKLEQIGQTVKEVMMFDEERMNEAFNKLFELRDSIQTKHLKIVRKIDYKGEE